MPRRSNIQAIRRLYENAGFLTSDNFCDTYKNQHQKHKVYDVINEKYIYLSVQTLKKWIKKGRVIDWSMLPFYEPIDTNAPQGYEQQDDNDHVDERGNNSFNRWLERQDDDLKSRDIEYTTTIYDYYKTITNLIARERNCEYDFENDNDDSYNEVLALCISLKDISSKILRRKTMILTLYDGYTQYYYNLNSTTISNLLNSIMMTRDETPHDSTDVWIFFDTYTKFTIEFKDRVRGRDVTGGFFPFINKSGYDLSKYGIYTSCSYIKPEPCIITALRNSNVFTENEMNEIETVIKVRSFPQQSLKTISDMFNVNIYVRKYHDSGKNSHVEFKSEDTSRRYIKMMIYKDHYMLYEEVKPKLSNYTLIKHLLTDGLLIPMTDKELDYVFTQTFNYDMTHKDKPFNSKRKIYICDKKPSKRYTKPGCYLFGYDVDDAEIDKRFNELQLFVDSLRLRKHINVRCYKKFSQLMLKIMYEYGCFDNVYEFSGEEANKVRSSLVFPKRELTTTSINEKVYYVDFNGAYTSFMTSIPTDLSSTGGNTKIQSLIGTMYERRIRAKQEGNDKLALSIKYLMNSCYGSSITKPMLTKVKYTDDVLASIRQHGELVTSYNNKDKLIRLTNPVVPHYSFPQFAKTILDGFNTKVDEIKSLVNVLYQNCDAFVIDERDYNKLYSLGYIHPTELGKLKVEHVFTKMVFKNKTRWYGVNLDGSIYSHGLEC